jgi:hypothetical protein
MHQPGSVLSNLWDMMGQRLLGRFVVHMLSATKATLHQGTTRLNVKKARVGNIEDCYAFIPYEVDEHDYELNVMEIHGIAVLRWNADEVEDGSPDALYACEDDAPNAAPGAFRHRQTVYAKLHHSHLRKL